MAKDSRKLQVFKAAQQYLETGVWASFKAVFVCLKLFGCLLLVVPAAVSAQVYKVVDEHGNVSFSDTPPKQGESEQLTNLDIANSYDSDSVRARQKQLLKDVDQQRALREETEAKYNAELLRLNESVDSAKQALEKAKTIKEGDYLATVSGGTRRSPDFIQRVEEAKALLQEAKAALAAFKGNRQ